MSITETYQAAFVKQATLFLKMGVDESRSKIGPSTDEVSITQYIVEALNELSRSGKVPPALRRFDASDEVRVNRHPHRRGKNRRIIDIRILRAGPPRPMFELEAKCLRCGRNTISDYAGGEGLGLFVNAEYAFESAYGGMLGYVQTNDPMYWLGQLKKKLDSDKDRLRLTGELTILDDSPFEHAFVTQHARELLGTVTIHHFFVTYC